MPETGSKTGQRFKKEKRKGKRKKKERKGRERERKERKGKRDMLEYKNFRRKLKQKNMTFLFLFSSMFKIGYFSYTR